ncbi:hypothetical protein [Criblamydia sequanensis]|uniref:Uncharacterized protein n=1 Tax=Candidatus Criblamydia sequanensis CRIB-18 TaxID=1437425 RepID=A0A090CXR2_9BACT|nr:hypothetical protein [Criblamydia sequanensis]CDR32902.1 hypothetical protein CSEC_0058 [Criblamydia sequanensis CRIB-18]
MQQQPLSPCLFLGMTQYPPTDLIIPKSFELEEGEIGDNTPETPVDLIRQIESHIEAGEYVKAKDLLCQAFSKNIFDDTPYYLYAKTLFAQGLNKLAIHYLKEIGNPNEMARELLVSCRKRKREAKEEQNKLAAKRAEIAREEPEISTSGPKSNLSSISSEEAAEEEESDRPEKNLLEDKVSTPAPQEKEESSGEAVLHETPSLQGRITPLSSSELEDNLSSPLNSILPTPAPQEKEESSPEEVLPTTSFLKDRVSPLCSHEKNMGIGSSSSSSKKNEEASSSRQKRSSREKESSQESRRDSRSSRNEREEDKRSSHSSSRDRDHERNSQSSSREKESRSSRKRSSESLRDSSTSRSDHSRDSHYSRSSNSYEDSSYFRGERSNDRSSSPSSRGSYSSRYESSSSYRSKEDSKDEKSIREKEFQKPRPYSEDELSRKKRRLASHTNKDERPISRDEEVGSLSVAHQEKQLDAGSVSSSESSQMIERKDPKTPADIFPTLRSGADFLTKSLLSNGLSEESLMTCRIGIPKLLSKDVIQNVSYRIVPLKWRSIKLYPVDWQGDKSNFCESLIAGFNLDEFFIQPRKTEMRGVPDKKNPTLPKNSEQARSFIKRNVREANDKLDLLNQKDMRTYSQPAPHMIARLSPDQSLNKIRFKTQSIQVSNLQEEGTHNTSGGVFYYVYRWLWKGLQQKNHILPGYTDLLIDGPLLEALKNKGFVIKIFRTEDVALARSKGEPYEPITIPGHDMQSTRTIRLLQTKLNDGTYHFDLLYPES